MHVGAQKQCRDAEHISAQFTEEAMFFQFTQHATARAQQRGIPTLITNWLLDYGEEIYDGHGGIVRYFTRGSVRRMERDIGATPIKRLSEYLRCYLVVSSEDGVVITVGKRYSNKRIWRH